MILETLLPNHTDVIRVEIDALAAKNCEMFETAGEVEVFDLGRNHCLEMKRGCA
jgi:hypothetical protein